MASAFWLQRVGYLFLLYPKLYHLGPRLYYVPVVFKKVYLSLSYHYCSLMTIILYDLPSVVPGSAFAPNPWKARAVLNYKRIPYRTEWLEFVDVAGLRKKPGIKPTSQRKDGSPFYTLPAIHDPSTGVYIADSFAIAEYLEKTYPDTPSVFPDNTVGIQKTFEPAFLQNISSLWPFIIPAVYDKVNPVSKEYFRRTREILFGKKLEEILPTGNDRTEGWASFKKGMDTIHSYLILTDNKGPYMLGDKISWSDLVLFSFLYWMKLIWGEDSQEWKDIASWNGGRWEAHVNALKEYQTVV